MILDKLYNYDRGWIVGDFFPTLHSTKDLEVAIHRHEEGTVHQKHYHEQAAEINVVISGKGRFLLNDDVDILATPDTIVVVEPGEIIQFEAIEDTVICVIKTKSVKGDKFLVE